MTTNPTIYRGQIIHCIEKTKLEFQTEILSDGGLLVNSDGKIAGCKNFQDLAREHKEANIIDTEGQLICPGFVDTHLHMPQLDIIGSYGDGLLDWLQTKTFPEETKFSDKTHSLAVSKRLTHELLANGVTSAVIFTATYKSATDSMFKAAHDSGLKAIIGKVSMDQNAPEKLLQKAESDIEDQESLIDTWHEKDQRLYYAITPRFAPTTSLSLFKALGKLREKYPSTWVQTHHSETKKEVEYVKELFPKSKDYLSVYDDYGLLGSQTILAHSIHSTDEELQRIIDSKTRLSHCPTSNFFLGSGMMPLEKYFSMGIPLSLGSDIGGGTSISPWTTMAEAYKTQAMRKDSPRPELLFYLSTLGGAYSLNKENEYGNFQIGKEADFQIINLQKNRLLAARSLNTNNANEFLLPIMMLGDDRIVDQVYVRGKKIYQL